MKDVKKAQNLLEYLLIFMMVALAAYMFSSKMNLTSIKNYVFVRPADSANPSHIKIEAMTDR